jgi:hypothetical protein
VLIYVTPHLWEPGMTPPLEAPKGFEHYPTFGEPGSDDTGVHLDREP